MAAGRLVDVLNRSRSLGFLGPGSVRVHIEHAKGFAAASDGTPGCFADLGSGGGVPGLVLALHWEKAQAVLLEAGGRGGALPPGAALGIRGPRGPAGVPWPPPGPGPAIALPR